MAEPKPVRLSPILRLDDYLWSLVTPKLGPNDVCRLLLLGNAVLSSILRRGTVELSVACSSRHPFDLNTALITLARYPRLSGFELRVLDAMEVAHAPRNWNLVPSHLKSLTLHYPHVISEILHLENLKDVLPSLEALDLQHMKAETLSRRAELISSVNIEWPLLPPLMTSLRLTDACFSSRIYTMRISRFETLPEGLKTLDLAINLKAIDHHYFRVIQKPQLPAGLPSSLTFLRLSGVTPYVHINLADLPSSLLECHLCIDCDFRLATDRAEEGLTIDFTGAESALPVLHTLMVADRRLTMMASQVLELLPPSVTVTNIAIQGPVMETDFERIFQNILPTLTAYYCGLCPELDREIFVESVLLDYHPDYTLPYLEKLVLNEQSATPLLKLPNTLTKLTAPILLETTLPESLRTLELKHKGIPASPPRALVYRYSDDLCDDENDHALSLTFNQGLKKISLPASFCVTHSTAKALPDSLEAIEGNFSEEALSMIFRAARFAVSETKEGENAKQSTFDLAAPIQRFPRLRSLLSTSITDCSYFSMIPAQLETLFVSVTGRTFSSASSSQKVLLGLKRSQLKTLSITVTKAEVASPLPAVVRLLNHLPATLTELHFSSQCRINERLGIEFPPNLDHLTINQAYVDVGQRSFSKDPPNWTSSLMPFATPLPESLQVLIVTHGLRGEPIHPKECAKWFKSWKKWHV